MKYGIFGGAVNDGTVDDVVAVGRAAVTNHDFPRLAKDPAFAMRTLPVPRATLRAEGLSESFIGYMGNWPGFAEAE
jgi:hypothetical protein